MNLLIEQLEMPHKARERERMIQRNDVLATARAARCRERGCHPVVEAISRMFVDTGIRLNGWAAPSHRHVRRRICPESNPARIA